MSVTVFYEFRYEYELLNALLKVPKFPKLVRGDKPTFPIDNCVFSNVKIFDLTAEERALYKEVFKDTKFVLVADRYTKKLPDGTIFDVEDRLVYNYVN